jgi:cytochrome b561
MTPKRYHSALVVLHWLLAIMLVVALTLGTLVLDAMPNSSPDKIGALQGHMVVGGLILVLMVVRLVVRVTTVHPAPASTGNALADRLAPLAHWALYMLVFAMAGSGITMSILVGLPDIVFGGEGRLPEDFLHLVPRTVHGIVAKLLMLAIALHVLAALYHQLVRRDGLLARMGFGPR